MRAIRHDGSTVRLDHNAQQPGPGPGEAIIRPTRMAVSASDVAAVSGLSRFVGILGHEFVGVVEEINLPSDATHSLRHKRQLKGMRVVGSPNIVCTNCDLCRAGLSAHCRSRRIIGVDGPDGCFADRFVLPLVNLHPVPESVDDDRAVMALSLARALHATQLVRVEAQTFVTVLGDSYLALLTAQALARLNASVRLLGTRPERVSLCERWGIKHRLLDDAGRRQDQDVVIDCTGSAAGLRLAMQLVRPRGVILLKSTVTSHTFPPGRPFPEDADERWSTPVDLTPLIANEVQVLGSRDGSLPDALALIEDDHVDVISLITRRCKLADGIEAIRQAGDRRHMKVIMEP